jgi:protein gp37
MAEPRIDAWWDASWNVVGGCSPVSIGCRRCYAALLSGTQQSSVPLYRGTTEMVRGRPVFNGKLTVWPPNHPTWRWPLKWKGVEDPLLGPGQPSLIFVGDMSDVFHERRPVTDIDQVVSAIAWSRHIGLLLTKRADVMARYFGAPDRDRRASWREKFWLGFSAERQQEFDERWPHIRELAARGWTVFVSVAPLLGPVVLPADFLSYGERVWVIASGEQGKDARPMDPAWARALRDQCAAANVPFFCLQMSGGEQIPRDLFVQQFPFRMTNAVKPLPV